MIPCLVAIFGLRALSPLPPLRQELSRDGLTAAHGRTVLERLGYAVAFCSVSAGVLPAAIWYLTLRPDALQLELALPILLGGLPGGLLVLVVRWLATRTR